MTKEDKNYLKRLLFTFIGLFIGTGIFDYWHFKTHPSWYVATASPWYYEILLRGVVFLILWFIAVVMLLLARTIAKTKLWVSVRNYFSKYNY